MIIIAGYIDFAPASAEAVITRSKHLIEGALAEEGCLDYDWSLNPLVPGRVRVFERWRDEACLAAHFQSRWYQEMGAALHEAGILGMDILKYETGLWEPVYDEQQVPRADFFTRPGGAR